MSVVRDWIDWLGGYPFEVASAETIIRFFESRGFRVAKLVRAKGRGNNEFVLVKGGDAAD
jgi:2-polyprenyl-6-hydroxyphenyl methylase/3-demethylubiquinone-9 3-methyltransferase